MNARHFIASAVATLLLALHTAASAAGDVQDHGQLATAHTLQSSPAKLPSVKLPPVQSVAIKLLPATLPPPILSGKLSSCSLTDTSGRPIKPCSIAMLGNDLYLLGPQELWCAKDAGLALKQNHISSNLKCIALVPSSHKIKGMPIQEFCDFVAFPKKKTFIVLEKSGDLLEFNPANNSWRMAWPNKPITFAPDPDYISLTALPDAIVLLDPERNELWRFDGVNTTRLINPEVLPWKVHRSKPNLADGLAVCGNGNIFVLRRLGIVTEYSGKSDVRAVRQLQCKPLGWLRPTRICNGSEELLIVDREHNALVELDKHSGKVKVQYFSPESDLRAVCAMPDGFGMINGDNLVLLPLSLPGGSVGTKNLYTSRPLDARFKKLRLPILYSRLPSHPGVWPGARRLYRYGVHKGVDFFSETGCRKPITNGTPVCAAGDGRIVRIDSNYKDLSEKQYAQIMKDCVRSHSTSESNEDLLRGCQVWIDHGNGLLTKYAHLDHVNHSLHNGDLVKAGSVIGYVGVSGTGENLPGRAKQPHLHFEVWVDGNYLGYGLTPAETIAVFERIFNCGC